MLFSSVLIKLHDAVKVNLFKFEQIFKQLLKKLKDQMQENQKELKAKMIEGFELWTRIQFILSDYILYKEYN